MQDLKTGDVITFTGDDEAHTVLREEVMGRLDQIVFTRQLFEGGSVSNVSGPQLIEDLITYGYTKEN